VSGKEKISGGNGRRVQVQAERKDAFTKEKKQVFLDHLAGCCNVSRSAKAAGVCVVTVHYQRRRDPEFGQAFQEALDTGYAALEAELLDRATRGGKYEAGEGAADVPGPETVDSELGLRLLALRIRRESPGRTRGGRAPTRVTEAELNEAILGKMALLGKRIAKRKRAK
jgi:hypothetical protein